MDSTPTPTPNPISAASKSKLPLKRKASESNPILKAHLTPAILPVDPNTFPPITSSKTYSDSIGTAANSGHQRPPPFKFHRIWTEPDEIRFLQGLIDCGSENLSFPRDLNVFYARFSNMMSQPYTKSQLSEKLRRLRKKYRVISTRLSKGLDQSFLSTHDRALYQLSRLLWHPDHAEKSPFSGTGSIKTQKSDVVGVKVNFLPPSPANLEPNLVENFEFNYRDDGFKSVEFGGEGKLTEVNVEFEKEGIGEGKVLGPIGVENLMGGLAVKAAVDAFDESLNEVRMVFANFVKEEGNILSFQKRWQEQRFAEMEALGRRMRLLFEHSLLQKQG